MKTTRCTRKFPASALACAVLLAAAQPAWAQSVRMPSTLRYGSGLLDVPVASVLPHLTFTGTYSGFSASIPEFVIVDPAGKLITPGSTYEKWLADGSLAVGLFDRAEVGVSIQHFASAEEGGNLFGGFARVSLLPSSLENLDLAVGAQYVNSPTFGDQYRYEFGPNRLAYPDSRLHKDVGEGDYSANLTPYAVATARLPLGGASAISLTGGWGSGLFSAGGDLDFHQNGNSGGIFGGAGVHIGIGGRRQLNLVGEYNGFDVNAGVQVDLGYLRVGGFALALTHDGYSTFRSRKFGVLGSVAFPTTKADTVITPYEVTLADTVVNMNMVVTADTTVTGRALSDDDRETLEALVLFEFDRFQLTEYAETQLEAKASVLAANPGVEVSIEGHADDLGTEAYNERLGMGRATSVRDFFTAGGVDASRLSAVSHGETMPLTEGRSSEARAQNRRVEFVITRETTPQTVITADTTMVPDTVITPRTEMRADTVVTPSRWGYGGGSDEQRGGDLSVAPVAPGAAPSEQVAVVAAALSRLSESLEEAVAGLDARLRAAAAPRPDRRLDAAPGARAVPFSAFGPGRALG